MTSNITKRLAAGVAALALGLTGAVALAGPASAAVPPNIAPDTNQSSIVVHKHSQPAGEQEPGDGTIVDPAPGDPINGVEFDLYKLSSVDLTTAAGWAIANAISEADGVVESVTGDPATAVTIGGVSYPVAAAGTQETAGQGTATFESLSYGIYLVIEGADNGDNGITTKAAPFVVSLPFATSDNTWLTTVHAYPKNSQTSITKTVQSSGYLVGSVVEWKVDVEVPQLAAGAALTGFSISDTFDVRLGNLGVKSVMIGTTTLAATDYVVGGTGQTVTVTPTLALVNAAQAQTVSVVFTSTVESLGADGIILNKAIANINGKDFTSAPVKVEYGEARILKYAAEDKAATLAGAQFALYATEAEATAALTGTVGTPIWTGTTPANGILNIGATGENPGIKVGSYFLAETVAPAGYNRTDTVIPVTVVAGGAGAPILIDVANTQVPPWELPLTGGDGALWFGLGGGALVLVAAGAALVIARRSKANA